MLVSSIETQNMSKEVFNLIRGYYSRSARYPHHDSQTMEYIEHNNLSDEIARYMQRNELTLEDLNSAVLSYRQKPRDVNKLLPAPMLYDLKFYFPKRRKDATKKKWFGFDVSNSDYYVLVDLWSKACYVKCADLLYNVLGQTEQITSFAKWAKKEESDREKRFEKNSRDNSNSQGFRAPDYGNAINPNEELF
jgi:hypothetical protein